MRVALEQREEIAPAYIPISSPLKINQKTLFVANRETNNLFQVAQKKLQYKKKSYS